MIETITLFPKLNDLLISLLRSLTPDEWDKPTIAKKWKVKDVAAHLLDGNCRMISIYRDHHLLKPELPIDSYESLVAYLNSINHDWVVATRRLSPGLITDMLEITGKEYERIITQLDPDDNALFAVAWAGHTTSKNWFHIAREFTEKWHHQQQIRDAVNRPGLMTMEFLHPLMATFLEGLPHTFKNADATLHTAITILIDDIGTWQLIKMEHGWEVSYGTGLPSAAEIAIAADTAWKLFTKGITPEAAEKDVRMFGNMELAKKVLKLVAVMA